MLYNTTPWVTLGRIHDRERGEMHLLWWRVHGSHFNDVGKLYQNINVTLIGAGAYAPAWFMAPMHQNSYDVLNAFVATRAKIFIPFHYGTFDLADEPLGEPEQILNQLKAEGKIENDLNILKLGEVFPC